MAASAAKRERRKKAAKPSVKPAIAKVPEEVIKEKAKGQLHKQTEPP